MIPMTKIQKVLLWILSTLTAVAVTMAACMYHAIYISPDSLRVRMVTWNDTAIPASMSDVSIVYFTDLEYGVYEDEQRAKKVFDQIQSLNPSVVIFGGDLFDENAKVSDADVEQMSEWFSSLEAPLGKFAVLGEMDTKSDSRLKQVEMVYANSQVELLNNSSVLLANRSSSGIRLAGISPEPDLEQAVQSFTSSTFNLLVSHYTDVLSSQLLESAPVSQVLAGNAHGTQITWPIFGGYTLWKGSVKINRANEPSLSFPYYISSGTGCTHVNARFNAAPEIVYILLENS